MHDEKGNTIKTTREKVNYVDNKTFEKKVLEYVKRKKMLQVNLEKAFPIILGRHTYDLQKELEANKDCPTIFSTQKALELLETIKITSYNEI